MFENLLATKLFVPPARLDLVPRQRLIERLDAGLGAEHEPFDRKLTLISAPAGYGKTTLAVGWISSSGTMNHDVAWISLDEEDDDPARFFTYLQAALERAGVEMGQMTTRLQGPTFPSAQILAGSFINEVTHHTRPLFLVLDDYHKVSDRLIHDSIEIILKHQPPKLHLVIITREDPPFSLSWVRGRGEMIEIRQIDLQFTMDETAIFLNEKMGLSLTTHQISALETRTEGWIAGLQLAALALQGLVSTQRHDDVHRFVQSFTGSNRFILDYLMDEVFRRQSNDIRVFLLKTAILNRLSGPLCAAVTGREDRQEVLVDLERANLFVMPLDDRRNWYRYHHLFAELLRYRLQQEGLTIGTLHERACRWYEANGLKAEAIHHALASGNWDRAAKLVEQISEQMLKQGQIATLLGWLQPLPEETLRTRPELCFNAGWALALSNQLEAAERFAEIVEPASSQSPALLSKVLALQAFIARARHDVPRTIKLSQKALSLLPPEDYNSRCVVGTNLGVAYIYNGDLATAMAVFDEAVRNGQRSANHHAVALALSFKGQIVAAWGKLHKAADLHRQAIQLGSEKGATPGTVRAHVNLAALLFEWNELTSAGEHLQQALELCKLVGDKHVERDAYRILAFIQLAQGDMSGAVAALGESQELLDDGHAPDNIELVFASSYVEIARESGDLATALRWWGRIEEVALETVLIRSNLLTSAGNFSPQLTLVQASLLLAQGNRAAAADLLADCHQAAAEGGFDYSRVKARLLQALAAPDPETAAAFLHEALTLAQPEGYVRSFVNEGKPLAALLRDVFTHNPDLCSYIQTLLDAFSAQLQEVKSYSAVPTSYHPLAPSLIDPLSERELEILHLLTEQQTNAEIAQALVLSPNTAKTHLQHIYEKLNVHDRRAAVIKARELNLLSS